MRACVRARARAVRECASVQVHVPESMWLSVLIGMMRLNGRFDGAILLGFVNMRHLGLE